LVLAKYIKSMKRE